jgi:hypothetical protein
VGGADAHPVFGDYGRRKKEEAEEERRTTENAVGLVDRQEVLARSAVSF